MKRKASFFVITSSLLLLVLFVSTGVAKSKSREDSPQACGPKFSLVPSENIYSGAAKGQNSLLSVATNGDQVVAVGFYEKRMYNLKGEYIRDRKSGLIEVWDGTKMLAKPVDLGGFENEMNWISADPNGGFKLVGTVWEMTVKGLRSKIVVGRFDGGQFVHEATIAIPGSVRNIPHRILVSGTTTWVDGYFTRQFGDPPTALKPEFGQVDRPYPYLPPYTKGEARTYPLLVKVEGAVLKRIRFPGEGWLDGMTSRKPGHLVAVGMSNQDAAVYEFQETWRFLDVLPVGFRETKESKKRGFRAFLDVVATPRGFVFSDFSLGFLFNPPPGPSLGIASLFELADGRLGQLGILDDAEYPETKVLIPALPGHQGVRFYGVSRTYRGWKGLTGRALFYPGYREVDYPFRFRGGGIATTKTEVWVAGGLNETDSRDWWQTAVLRACPPLKVVAGTETPPPQTETP